MGWMKIATRTHRNAGANRHLHTMAHTHTLSQLHTHIHTRLHTLSQLHTHTLTHCICYSTHTITLLHSPSGRACGIHSGLCGVKHTHNHTHTHTLSLFHTQTHTHRNVTAHTLSQSRSFTHPLAGPVGSTVGSVEWCCVNQSSTHSHALPIMLYRP